MTIFHRIFLITLPTFIMVGCSKPTPPPVPPVPSSGGLSSTGGNGNNSGGLISIGGNGSYSPAAGGTGTPGCPMISYPDTPLPQTLAKKIVKHKLPSRHFRPRWRAKPLPTTGLQCSGGAIPLIPTPLDQIDGSCTGAASVGMISTPPFTTSTHFNISDSLLAYQGGTCEDNNCTCGVLCANASNPSTCSCNNCPIAYCPSTHANDVGSNGNSVAKWMVTVGWLSDYLAADTTDSLMAGLSANKTCIIGVDWLDSMWTPDATTGEIHVDPNTAMQGGHEMHAVFSDLQHGRVWVRNSWGAWGWCFKKLMTPKSPIDGTGCGYGWISVKNLMILRFDGDCPN